MTTSRQDVLLAGYACVQGFGIWIEGGKGAFKPNGQPNSNTFEFIYGKYNVFATARGWRVAQRDEDGKYLPVQLGDFHKNLKDALDAVPKL